MKHEDLKQNDIVIFKRYCDILEREDYQDGNVVAINPERKEVDICWLEGYSSRVDSIKYDKVIAKYNKEGEYMTFGAYKGNSILLEWEE